MDQGSNKNHSPAYHFAPTVTKFCVIWEGSSLPHDTKFGNSRCEIVDSRAFPSWSLIHGLRWSGLIKAEPGMHHISSVNGIQTIKRHKQVLCHNELSCFVDVICGVPQGSVLGPFLFLLFIYDISQFTTDGCLTNLYADDSMIYASGDNILQVQQKLQQCVKKI